MKPRGNRHPASFRDPSGFIFEREGTLYRQINTVYEEDYDHLMSSGLYQSLITSSLLIPHQEVDLTPYHPESAYKTIRPDPLKFISYPYEWSFSAFRNAALATLQVHELALKHGMILKDASAYNIQFQNTSPLLIDSLSFQRWIDGRPWDGYRQFCQHFLAPLALMALVDIRLSRLLTVYLDGIPLDLASRLLPRRTKLNPSMLTHIHLHSALQSRASSSTSPATARAPRQMNMNSLLGMSQNLRRTIEGLRWDPGKTKWADYYATFSYSDESIKHKEKCVATFLASVKPTTVWDMGANTGRFSRIASDQGIFTVSMDMDEGAVEANYKHAESRKDTSILPLVIDMTNPSPDIGWRLKERRSLSARGPVDAILALALVHHLAIGNNVPFPEISTYFAEQCTWLLIEFIPKDDVQVERMLRVRKDIFDSYHQTAFEDAFTQDFEIEHMEQVVNSSRIMYSMKRRANG